jgi:hypothetical protein
MTFGDDVVGVGYVAYMMLVFLTNFYIAHFALPHIEVQ